MSINHSDRCWWRSFGEDVKRAFRRNDLEAKAHLYELYERHMTQRLMREYYYYKRLDYEDLRNQGLVSKGVDFFDWLKDNRY